MTTVINGDNQTGGGKGSSAPSGSFASKADLANLNKKVSDEIKELDKAKKTVAETKLEIEAIQQRIKSNLSKLDDAGDEAEKNKKEIARLGVELANKVKALDTIINIANRNEKAISDNTNHIKDSQKDFSTISKTIQAIQKDIAFREKVVEAIGKKTSDNEKRITTNIEKVIKADAKIKSLEKDVLKIGDIENKIVIIEKEQRSTVNAVAKIENKTTENERVIAKQQLKINSIDSDILKAKESLNQELLTIMDEMRLQINDNIAKVQKDSDTGLVNVINESMKQDEISKKAREKLKADLEKKVTDLQTQVMALKRYQKMSFAEFRAGTETIERVVTAKDLKLFILEAITPIEPADNINTNLVSNTSLNAHTFQNPSNQNMDNIMLQFNDNRTSSFPNRRVAFKVKVEDAKKGVDGWSIENEKSEDEFTMYKTFSLEGNAYTLYIDYKKNNKSIDLTFRDYHYGNVNVYGMVKYVVIGFGK